MADAPPLDAGSLIGVTFGVTRSSSMSNLNRTLGPATARVSALAHRGAGLGRGAERFFFGFWRLAHENASASIVGGHPLERARGRRRCPRGC